MRRKIWRTILCLAFVAFFVVSSVPLTAFAAAVDAKLIEYSDVYTDLKTMGIDPTKYPKDITATHVRMLHFIEWGYDYNGDQRDYGLYVYVYNPSGKEIDLGPYKNHVQIQTYNNFTVPNGWCKMELEKCSVSLREGYENVFYKFKIKDAGKLLDGLQKSQRIYEISGIELRYKDSSYDLDSKVKARYTYTGYMEYHGLTGSATRTLHHEVLDTFALELDLQPATWKTKTSDKGAGYQYELFSTYFAVPNDIIKDYGDANNATKGLIAVDGEYDEYRVNGIVTQNDAIYDILWYELNQPAIVYGFSGGYPTLNFDGSYNGGFCVNYEAWTGEGVLDSKNEKPYDEGWMRDPKILSMPELSTVLRYSHDQIQGISAKDYLAALQNIEKYYGYPTALPSGAKENHSYSVKAGNDLAGQIANYATTHQSGLKAWLSGEYSLFKESKDDVYSGINSIQVVDSSFLDAGKTDAWWSETYFIQESEVTDFRNYVKDHRSGETVFKINFAVRDYYITPITFFQGDNKWNTSSGTYYYEKTTFRDFDVMTLTWQDQYGKKTVMPVVAKPIDIVGSITPPAGSGSFVDTTPGKDDGNGCQELNYRPIVILIGFLIACIVINVILSVFGLNIGEVLKWLWKVITWPFRMLWKGLKSLFKSSKKKKTKKAKDKPEKRRVKKRAEDMTDEDWSALLEEYDKKRERRKKNGKKER